MTLKATIGTICAAATLLSSATAQQKMEYGTYAADQKRIEAMTEQGRAAAVNAQTDVLRNLLADDFIEIGPDGKSVTRDEGIGRLQSGELKIQSLSYSDTKVKVYIGDAVVTGLATLKGTFKDKDIGGDYRFIDVYEIRKNVWKLAYRQITPIKKDEKKDEDKS